MDLSQIYQHFTEYPHISTDSRVVKQNSIFFALKGDNHDGNMYAKQALFNGAVFAVVDDPAVVESEKYILVNDTLETLQQLALFHRKKFNIPVLVITGTNGKTTTKELIAAVLGKKFNTLFTKGNLNNHIGVPLTLLELNRAHEMAIIEMGASHTREIDALCQIALPAYGLITNIGYAHLEGFGSLEGVIAAKSELYSFIRQQLGKVFVNKSDDVLMQKAGNISQVTYGLDPSADYRREIIRKYPYLALSCYENCTSFQVQTQLAGSYNADNVIAAVCVGRYFGVSVKDVTDAIASYLPQNNRSQFIDTGKNHIILDAYNANPSSMTVAIENFSTHPQKPKMCILGDMLELGNHADAEHRKIFEKTYNAAFDTVIFVGEHFSKQKINNPDYHFFTHTRQAKEWLASHQICGYNILIKGSRKIQLETLVDNL